LEVNVANIKSAKKRIQVTLVRTERNKVIRSKVKTAIKKVESAVAANDKQLAKDNLKNAIVEITKAASKGVYHKNNASRKVARLSKAVDSINA
jgi:ribosomal protein S20